MIVGLRNVFCLFRNHCRPSNGAGLRVIGRGRRGRSGTAGFGYMELLFYIAVMNQLNAYRAPHHTLRYLQAVSEAIMSLITDKFGTDMVVHVEPRPNNGHMLHMTVSHEDGRPFDYNDGLETTAMFNFLANCKELPGLGIEDIYGSHGVVRQTTFILAVD